MGGRLARWLMNLQQFDFHVEYLAEKHHTNADALSRIPPAEPVMSMTHNLLGTSSVDMRAAQQADEQLSPVITALFANSRPPHNAAPGLIRSAS